jgi:hypothetical protein
MGVSDEGWLVITAALASSAWRARIATASGESVAPPRSAPRQSPASARQQAHHGGGSMCVGPRGDLGGDLGWEEEPSPMPPPPPPIHTHTHREKRGRERAAAEQQQSSSSSAAVGGRGDGWQSAPRQRAGGRSCCR